MSDFKIPVRKLHVAALVACGAALLATSQPVRAAEVLITEAEAKLPPIKGGLPIVSRGITRGPHIEMVDTGSDGSVHSPMHLQIKFQAFGGAKVDMSALQVTYLKSPEVDLTDRIKPFEQASSVDMPEAVLPPGDHLLRVDIKDSDGRTATSNFTIKVAP